MHNLVPKGQKQKCPSTRPKASVYSDGPKGLYLICISTICISYLYHCISISFCNPYLYHCNSVIIIPHAYALKRQKRPNTRPKASICVQTGPKGLSSHIIYITVSGGEGYCLMISKTIIVLIFTYLFTIF